MNSTVEKRRNTKIDKTKKGLVPSKFKTEETEDNSNAVNTLKRYNLRSYSTSKDTSKMEKSKNVDSEYMKTENQKKVTRKDKIIDPVSFKHISSPKKIKNDLRFPSKLSRKTENNTLTKRQIPKYLPTTEAENIFQESNEADFHLASTFPPYKSILKKVEIILEKVEKPPVKHPHVSHVDEKDTIKERIYGIPALRQKKVTFKTMSCQNLETMSYENNPSKEMEEISNICETEQISALKDNHILEEKIEFTSENNTSNLFIKILNENSNNCEKSAENDVGERRKLLSEKTQTLDEHQNFCQLNKNKHETSGNNLPILGLFNQNVINSSDDDIKTKEENKNEHQSDNKNLLDVRESNKTVHRFEDFRILKKIKTPDNSQKINTLQTYRDNENLENRHMECGDHGNKLDFEKGGVITTEEILLNDTEFPISKDKDESSPYDTLVSFTTIKSPFQDQQEQKRSRRKDASKIENDNNLKLATLRFLQEMNKRENIKMKSPLTNLNRTDEKTIYHEVDVEQDALKNKNEFFNLSREEKNNALLQTLSYSNDEICNTPQKTPDHRKKNTFDINLSDFKSPSKIPRLKGLQNRNSPFSPSYKADTTPTKPNIIEDEITQIQNILNNSFVSEDKIDKRNELNESILTHESSILSKGKDIDLSSNSDSDMINDSLKIQEEQEKCITLPRNERHPGQYDDFESCISDDEYNLLNSSMVYEKEENDSYECKNIENSEISQRVNTSTLVKHRTVDGKRCDNNHQRSEKNSYLLKTDSNEEEWKGKAKTPFPKRKINRINSRAFIMSFLISLLLYSLLLKMFDIPSCGT